MTAPVFTRRPEKCLGGCGRGLVPKRRDGGVPGEGEACVYARGMCAGCHGAMRRQSLDQPTRQKERITRAELEGYWAARRKRGIPVEGAPLSRKAA